MSSEMSCFGQFVSRILYNFSKSVGRWSTTGYIRLYLIQINLHKNAGIAGPEFSTSASPDCPGQIKIFTLWNIICNKAISNLINE